MVKSHVEESLGANPADAAINPADSVAAGVPSAKAPHIVEPPRAGIFRALVHRDYRLMFGGFCVNQTGFWISHICLQGMMVSLTGNDPFYVGLLFFAILSPALFFAPIAGVVADRMDRKRIMMACNVAVFVIAGGLSLVVGAGAITPALTLLFAFGLGMTFSFAGPASSAIAANVVHADDLASAVALQSATNNLTRVAGPILAAPFLSSGNFSVGFGVFSLTALGAAFLVSRMSVTTEIEEAEDGGILARLKSGLTHAQERPPAMAVLALTGGLAVFGIASMAMLPLYAEVVLGDADLFPVIVAVGAFGAMIGALVTGRLDQPTLRRALLLQFLYSLFFLGFAQTDRLEIALACQFMMGFCYFSVMTGLQTLLQQIVDDHKRGRVMSLFQVAWAGFTPIGSLIMGAVAGPLGIVTTLSGSAVICVAVGLVVGWWDRASGRVEERRKPMAA